MFFHRCSSLVYVLCTVLHYNLQCQRCKVQALFTHFHTGFTTFKPQSIGGFTLNKNQGFHYYFTFVDSSYFELTLLSTTTPLPRRLNICIELIKILTRPPVVVNRASSLSSWALLLKVASSSG